MFVKHITQANQFLCRFRQVGQSDFSFILSHMDFCRKKLGIPATRYYMLAFVMIGQGMSADRLIG